MRNIILYSILLLICSCKKPVSTSNIERDKDYFPLEIGNWIEYDVDSIVLNDFFSPAKIDTFQSIMRLMVTDTFRDNTGDLTYEMTYYWKQDDTLDWKTNLVWSISDEGQNIQSFEQNLRVIKLVYPITSTVEWYGDAFFSPTDETAFYGSDTFKYGNIHEADIINDIQFDSTVSVEANRENLIERFTYHETYAKGIGMIYKKYVHLEKQNIGGDWENGFDIEFKVRDYKGN